MKFTNNNIVLKILGLLLLVGALLKVWQLVTEPVYNNDIWSYRPFLIFVVEFELALAIWLLSGVFKKAAWLTILICFCTFSCITLYKGLTGAASCGCFGKVHVNPWITLFAIDIPAVIVLMVFKRKGEKIFDWPSIPHFVTFVAIGLVVLGLITPVLVFNKPAKVTSSYEILEPEVWVGEKLPVFKYIDIAKPLQNGSWLVLFYHKNCVDCTTAMPYFEQISLKFISDDNLPRTALVEIPPYSSGHVSTNSSCLLGRLANTKKWFLVTPTTLLISNGEVLDAWEGKLPKLDYIIEKLVAHEGTIL